MYRFGGFPQRHSPGVISKKRNCIQFGKCQFFHSSIPANMFVLLMKCCKMAEGLDIEDNMCDHLIVSQAKPLMGKVFGTKGTNFRSQTDSYDSHESERMFTMEEMSLSTIADHLLCYFICISRKNNDWL